MIIEAIIIGTSSIFVSSLWFANALLKREDADDDDDDDDDDDENSVEIKPFQVVKIGCRCAVCGTQAIAKKGTTEPYGIATVPRICKDNKCPASSQGHLHVSCTSCNSEYFMATADGKKAR